MGPVDVVIGLPLSIKIAWGVWMAWAVAHAVWYRRSGSAAAKPVVTATSRTRSESRPMAKRPSSSSAVRVPAPYGSPDFITALDAEKHGVSVQSQQHVIV